MSESSQPLPTGPSAVAGPAVPAAEQPDYFAFKPRLLPPLEEAARIERHLRAIAAMAPPDSGDAEGGGGSGIKAVLTGVFILIQIFALMAQCAG